ncbi:MAG TPA: type II 3-dehydroquinate dehydratase [Rhizomicrobium sp.]|jgi:3-dehydroquinate dehydratase-2|nr:type II 3-dehydroquinate dehydratase [Rhizomicrobium sp.]
MPKPRRREQTLPIYVLNGPNLNLLGRREPEIYGTRTLADIEKAVTDKAESLGWAVDFRQSNSEGELVDWLHEAREKASGVILNAGGYSHTSIALLDACRAVGKPLVEVHLSNPYGREHFRRHSYISEAASGIICGFGGAGYLLAIDALSELLKAHAR